MDMVENGSTGIDRQVRDAQRIGSDLTVNYPPTVYARGQLDHQGFVLIKYRHVSS
jgi:hypothetical protein